MFLPVLGDSWHRVIPSDHRSRCCCRSCRDSSSHPGPEFSFQADQVDAFWPIRVLATHASGRIDPAPNTQSNEVELEIRIGKRERVQNLPQPWRL